MNELIVDVVNGLRSRLRFEIREGQRRVWLLSALMAFAGAILYFNGLKDLPSPLGTDKMPWVTLIGLFYITEACAVRFNFKREAHSFSLSEVPIVIGLFTVAPKYLVLAQLIGSAAALLVHRRQPLLKTVFNLSHFFMGTGLAVLFFRQVAPQVEPGEPLQWFAVYLATLIATVVGISATTCAISLSEGKFDTGKLMTMLVFAVGVTLTNSGLGLVATTVLLAAPRAAWLLLIPVSTLFAAYRAFMSERQKKESIEFLYESTSILHRSPEIDSAICAVLSEARGMFRSEVAEVILLPANDGDRALRVTIGPDDEESIRYVDQVGLDSLVAGFGPDFNCLLFTKPLDNSAFEQRLKDRGITDGMMSVLRGETRIIGTILIANRVGDVTTFDPEDVRLLESLANHLSVAFEYGRLESSLTELRRLQEELTHQAFHDSLTGLANRELFKKVVEEALERTTTSGESISVLFVDLDDFKTINDTMGHAAGDELLAEVGRRITACLRSTDTAARLGGDEFAILLENTQLKDAVSAANRIRDTLRVPASLREKEVVVHASVGIAMGGTAKRSAEEFLRHADVAMYKAKAEGKDCYEVFESSMQEAVNRRQELKETLRRAVESSDFIVEYQPIVELMTGRVAAAEALVRWNHPTKGIVPPSEFIPLAEETGLVFALGRFVLKKACEDARRWEVVRPNQPPVLVSVNLSLRQLQDPEFAREVAETLKETGLRPSNLILEITESVLMHDAEAVVASMRSLKDLGVLLAIDDFGTGYSSLSYLRKMPVDYIKIAKPFVDDLVNGREARAFVEGIVALGRIMGLKIIGEGIEFVEQKDYLRDMNCHYGQGHYYSRSVVQLEIQNLLRQNGLSGYDRYGPLEEQYDENPNFSELTVINLPGEARD